MRDRFKIKCTYENKSCNKWQRFANQSVYALSYRESFGLEDPQYKAFIDRNIKKRYFTEEQQLQFNKTFMI